MAEVAPPYTPEAICRTAIASIMGRDPKIVRVTRTTSDVLFLSYVRPIDNFVWDYRCKIQGKGARLRSAAHGVQPVVDTGREGGVERQNQAFQSFSL
jgi:hypothetical protein